ncbi:hypothetical protein ABKN59_004312 [Abortiporus biennis]
MITCTHPVLILTHRGARLIVPNQSSSEKATLTLVHHHQVETRVLYLDPLRDPLMRLPSTEDKDCYSLVEMVNSTRRGIPRGPSEMQESHDAQIVISWPLTQL